MLAGHYGVAYALRARWPKTRLWHVFLAVQATDIAFSALAIAGIETLRINPAGRGPLSLDLVISRSTFSLRHHPLCRSPSVELMNLRPQSGWELQRPCVKESPRRWQRTRVSFALARISACAAVGVAHLPSR